MSEPKTSAYKKHKEKFTLSGWGFNANLADYKEKRASTKPVGQGEEKGLACQEVVVEMRGIVAERDSQRDTWIEEIKPILQQLLSQARVKHSKKETREDSALALETRKCTPEEETQGPWQVLRMGVTTENSKSWGLRACVLNRGKKVYSHKKNETVCHRWGQPSHLRRRRAGGMRTETGVILQLRHSLNFTLRGLNMYLMD